MMGLSLEYVYDYTVGTLLGGVDRRLPFFKTGVDTLFTIWYAVDAAIHLNPCETIYGFNKGVMERCDLLARSYLTYLVQGVRSNKLTQEDRWSRSKKEYSGVIDIFLSNFRMAVNEHKGGTEQDGFLEEDELWEGRKSWTTYGVWDKFLLELIKPPFGIDLKTTPSTELEKRMIYPYACYLNFDKALFNRDHWGWWLETSKGICVDWDPTYKPNLS